MNAGLFDNPKSSRFRGAQEVRILTANGRESTRIGRTNAAGRPAVESSLPFAFIRVHSRFSCLCPRGSFVDSNRVISQPPGLAMCERVICSGGQECPCSVPEAGGKRALLGEPDVADEGLPLFPPRLRA